jgi:protein KTI12
MVSPLLCVFHLSSGTGAAAQVNDRIDRVISEFSTELLRAQAAVPAGGTLTICGVTFVIEKPIGPGQLKKAKREFANRAKTAPDSASIAQMSADSLTVL